MTNMTELRLMIEDLNGNIGFTLVPTLQDGSGWIMGAFTDCVNVVEIRYYNVAIPQDSVFNYKVTSEAQRAEWFMGDMKEVAEKVVDLLTTRTLG